MNEKTVKLLKRYARSTGKSEKEIKRHWETLNREERTRERKRIEAELAKPTG